MYLFATGKEIKEHISDSVDSPTHGSFEGDPFFPSAGGYTKKQDLDELWEEKEWESEERGYPDQFVKEGIRRPVTIVPDSGWSGKPHFTMGQGHHRVATADLLSRGGHEIYVPVVYDDDYNYSEWAHHDDYPFTDLPKGAPRPSVAQLLGKELYDDFD